MKHKSPKSKIKTMLMFIRQALIWPLRKIVQLGVRLLIKLLKKTNTLRFIIKVINRYQNLEKRWIYNAWAVDNEKECFEQETKLTTQPMISVVVPTYNTVTEHLMDMVYSVVNQHYANWELVLVNASDDISVKKTVKNCEEIDVRIRAITVKQNLGIADNTNLGILAAKGKYIAFLDHDDKLHPCALHSVASTIINNNADLIYSDEDKINHNGDNYFDPHYKPKWSPDLLRNVNYINHLTVIKTEFVKKVNGLRAAFDGAQDLDLLFRVIDICQPKIEHIPRVLYHWRAADSSTASDITNKQYVLKAGERALQEHLDRNNQKARAEILPQRPGFYKVVHKSKLPISIVIGPVNSRWQRACAFWLEELLKVTTQGPVELIIGDWYSSYPLTQTDLKVKIANKDNYWSSASKLISNEIVICFQTAALPSNSSELWQLAAVAGDASCSTASPVIINKHQTILDAGLVESDFGLQPLFTGFKLSDSTPFGSVEWVRDVAAPSLSVFATKKEYFTKLVAKHNRKNHSDSVLHPDSLPDLTGNHIVWSHTPFTHKGSLQHPNKSSYFNPQLHLSQSLINIRTSSWEKLHDHAND